MLTLIVDYLDPYKNIQEGNENQGNETSRPSSAVKSMLSNSLRKRVSRRSNASLFPSETSFNQEIETAVVPSSDTSTLPSTHLSTLDSNHGDTRYISSSSRSKLSRVNSNNQQRVSSAVAEVIDMRKPSSPTPNHEMSTFEVIQQHESNGRFNSTHNELPTQSNIGFQSRRKPQVYGASAAPFGNDFSYYDEANNNET